MLKVRGMASMVMKAGAASVKSDQATRAIDCVIKAPTTIRAEAVAHQGPAAASGEKNIAARKSAATGKLLSPVRAPAATPAALSM